VTLDQPVPAAPGEAVASTLVATLERAWQSIVGHHPEVPDVVVVVAPGSGGRDLKLGHFAAGRWEVEGSERCELLVGAEGLRYGSLDVLGTLLHEAAHGIGWARGVVDTSRGGRYHNRRYKLLAEEVEDATAARYRATLADIDVALVLWRRVEASAGRGTASGRNPVTCECPCGRRIRMAQATISEGPVTCGLCGGAFVPPAATEPDDDSRDEDTAPAEVLARTRHGLPPFRLRLLVAFGAQAHPLDDRCQAALLGVPVPTPTSKEGP
jgi:hypothetical protein